MKFLSSCFFSILALAVPTQGFCKRGMPIGPAENFNGYVYAGLAYFDPLVSATGDMNIYEDAPGAASSGDVYYGGSITTSSQSSGKIDPAISKKGTDIKSGFSAKIGYDTGLGISIELEGSYIDMESTLSKTSGDYDILALRSGSYIDPTKQSVLPSAIIKVLDPLDKSRIGFPLKLSGNPSFYGLAGNVIFSSESIITPYAGGGFGLARVTLFGKDFNKAFYNLMIGAIYRLEGGIEISAGYRMTGFIDNKYTGFTPVYPIPDYKAYDATTSSGQDGVTRDIAASTTATIDTSLLFHRIEVGVKFRF